MRKFRAGNRFLDVTRLSKEAVMYITVGVYFALMVAVGFIYRRSARTISDFTVGSRSASAWMSAFSYGTAYFSAVMFIGYAGGTGWKYGLWGVLPGIGNAVFGSLLAWYLLADRTRDVTRRLNIRSMPQFFQKRFGSNVMKQFCVFVIFIFLVPYSASVYKGLSSVCAVLLGIDETLCMIIIALAAAALVLFGGYVATLKADFFQGIIMIIGVVMLIVVVFRSQQVGGFSHGISEIAGRTEALALGTKDHIGLWATVLMTSFGTWGLPQMVHKYYGIKDKAEVKRGIVISTLFALIIAGGGYLIGSLSHLFFDSLPEKGTDYLVPNMLASAGLPDVLLGVVLVLLISASVSTLASITITASTTLTMDFLQDKIFKKMPQERAGLLAKCVAALFIVVSYFIANTDTPILDMMSYSWGIISGSFMAPYLISLYWKRLNRAGAWAGMIGGFVTACPPVLCKLFFPSASSSFGLIADLGPHFACLSMAVSLVLCVVVSLLSGKKRDDYGDFYNTADMKDMPAGR